MIGYTLPELRRLLTSLVQARAPDPERVWSWSRWRRRRQYQARICHYRQRGYALSLLPSPGTGSSSPGCGAYAAIQCGRNRYMTTSPQLKGDTP